MGEQPLRKGETSAREQPLRDRDPGTTRCSVLDSNRDSGSSNTERSLEYQNFCGTGQDPGTDTIPEAAVAGAASASNEHTTGFVGVKHQCLLGTEGPGTPSCACIGNYD